MDTTHNDRIPPESKVKIEKQLASVLEIMLCEKNSPKYKTLIDQLPFGYRDEYHRIMQFGAMYILAMSFAKRGREGKKNIKHLFTFETSGGKVKVFKSIQILKVVLYFFVIWVMNSGANAIHSGC